MPEEYQSVEVQSASSDKRLRISAASHSDHVEVLILPTLAMIIVRRDELLVAIETLCGKDGAK